MEMTALGYARKKEVPVSFGLREKLGGALEKDAEKDNLDLVSIIDRSSDCIVHSCRPPHTETAIPAEQTETALSGLSSAGIMIMTKAEAETEGPEIPSERIPVMIGMAPVRDRNMEKIIAALAVRRFFRTDTLKKIGKALNTEAALLYGNDLIASSARFVMPENMNQVTAENKITVIPCIRAGGNISCLRFQR